MYSSSAPVWWKQMAPKLARAKNLRVLQIAADTATELERLCQRNMQLQVTIQDGEIWMRDAVNAVQVQLSVIMPGAH
jgi:uncharacterized protein YaeQ